MKTKIGLALILVLIISFSGFAVSGQNGEPLTVIDLKVKDPEMVVQAVQLAIFYSDPISRFKSSIWTITAQTPEIERQYQLVTNWDGCFRNITGDKLYLITIESQQYSPGSFFAEDLWFATKAVWISQRPVCWCVPIKVKKGERYQILLSPKNRIDLEELYTKLTKK